MYCTLHNYIEEGSFLEVYVDELFDLNIRFLIGGGISTIYLPTNK